MPQRFKLRLGDGTVLVVDQGGLNTWLVDGKAKVQAADGRWHPLREVLARQRAAAKYASPPESSRAALPLIPPPPRKDRTPPAEPAPLEEVPASLPSPSEAAGAPPPTEEPLGAEVEAPRLLESPSPDLPPSEPANLRAWADEPAVPWVEPRSYPPPPDEAAPMIPPVDEKARSGSEFFSEIGPWEVPAGEPPDLQAWADEPAASPAEAVSYSAPAYEEAPMPLPSPVEEEAPGALEPPRWHEPVEPSPVARPSLQVLADDLVEGDAPKSWTPDDQLPTIALKPLDDRDEVHARAPSGPATYEPDAFVDDMPRSPLLDQRLVRAADALGRFLTRCIDGLEDGYRRVRSTLPGLPVLRRAGPSSPSAPEEPHPSLGGQLRLQVLAEDTADSHRQDTRGRATNVEELPIIRLKPLEGERAPLRAAHDILRRMGGRASAWWVDLKQRIDVLTRRDRPASASPASEPASWSEALAPPREPLKAPAPISELPVLRLAKIDEPKEEEDFYEGESESRLQAAWIWTRRVVMIGGLVGAGVVAAVNWQAWFPKATRLGEVGFGEVASYLRSREQSERARRALQEATEQLPHLAPETIRLVLSRSPSGVLDPPDLFQRACDATDRGLSALTGREAEELKELQSALLDALSPAEGERVREYDRARARRATFAFEDRSALDLVARGSRALPPESLERLQVLTGRAVAAGLALPTEVARGAARRR